jgi:multisubunit Na+/H+ antiporter MnhG subunit
MRNTRFGVALRRAHEAGKPVLLGVEIAAVAIVACAAAWSATSSSSAAPVVTIAISLAVALGLVVIASLALADDAPPAPSWFARQRAKDKTQRPRLETSA